jgi:hypothetical protein
MSASNSNEGLPFPTQQVYGQQKPVSGYLTLTIIFSSSNSRAASALASSVLPTPEKTTSDKDTQGQAWHEDTGMSDSMDVPHAESHEKAGTN